jgi:sodium/hydrogen exchanger 8
MVASHLWWSHDLISPFGTIELCRLATLEACLVTLFPYAAYMMADGLELSGIVAILFAGIVRQRKHVQQLHENPKKLL